MLIWVNFAYFASVSNDLHLALIFYRLNVAAVPLFVSTFFFFYIVYYLKVDNVAKKLGKLIFVIAVSLSLFAILTNWIVKEVLAKDWGNEIVFGPLGLLVIAFGALVGGLIFYYSIRRFSVTSQRTRSGIFLFFLGVLLFIISNIIFNGLFVILFQTVKYQIFGDFSSIFLVGFTAYAIVRHELFDIKIVATEALTVFIWVILVAKLFASETPMGFLIDAFVLGVMIVFGIFLVRSVIREVKQRRKLEELTRRLKELDNKKDEFISVAAHELRAPMTAIKGYLSMLMEGDAGGIPDKAKEFLIEAMAGNDRLIRLVNNMLNVSRIEEGRLVYDMAHVSLSEVVKLVYDDFKPEAEERNLEYTLSIPKNLKDTVYVDKDRIFEVISNFISNAIKYTDKGQVKVSLSQANPNLIRFEVEDSGVGISQKDKEKLFTKFFRAESSEGKVMGTGLGLYISKLLIEKFGGRIGFESTLGKGSTFWFDLPVVS